MLNLIFVTGAPRSGTTYLASLLARSPRILMLDEFPLRDLIDGEPFKSLILKIYGSLRNNVSRSFFDDLSSLKEVTTFFAEGSLSPGSYEHERYVENINRAKRSMQSIEHAVQHDIHRNIDLTSPAERTLRYKLLQVVATHFFDATKASEALIYFGFKKPGITDNFDLLQLSEIAGRIKVIMAFRSPYEVIESSYIRARNTAHGFDDWHINDLAAALREWVENFYFTRYLVSMADIFGFDVMPISYHCLGDEHTVDQLSNFIGTKVSKPANFSNLASVPSPMRSRAVEEIEELCRGAGLPSRAEMDGMVASRAGLAEVMALTPHFTTDSTKLDFSDANLHGVIVFGFDQPEIDGRWMIGQCGSIYFPLPPSAIGGTVVIKISQLVDMESGNRIHLNLNGSHYHGDLAVGADIVSIAEDHSQLHGVMMRNCARSWNVLSLRVDRTARIQPDPRPLALKLKSMEFVAID